MIRADGVKFSALMIFEEKGGVLTRSIRNWLRTPSKIYVVLLVIILVRKF
jgi:hypothetical protein